MHICGATIEPLKDLSKIIIKARYGIKLIAPQNEFLVEVSTPKLRLATLDVND